MEEIWKTIEEFPNYEVSNMGQIRNKTTGHIRKPRVHRGYCDINIMKNNTRIYRRVHRLVAIAFIPNPDNLPEINHINEDRTDNRVENLEWCDRTYNNNYGNHPKNCHIKKS